MTWIASPSAVLSSVVVPSRNLTSSPMTRSRKSIISGYLSVATPTQRMFFTNMSSSRSATGQVGVVGDVSQVVRNGPQS